MGSNSTLVVIAIVLLGLFIFAPLFVVSVALFGASDQGETPTTTTQVAGTNDTGPISDAIPDNLAKVFADASRATGTPVALIAAISYQECNQVWGVAKKSPDVFQNWVDSNVHVDRRGCGYDNGYNVWGPMQFLYNTFYNNGPDPRQKRNAAFKDAYWQRTGTHPDNDPAPTPSRTLRNGQLASGAFGFKAQNLTSHRPASILNVRDTIFAAAVMLNEHAGSPTQWNEAEIRKAAGAYFGNCSGDAFGATVHYCDDIVRRWKQYSSSNPT